MTEPELPPLRWVMKERRDEVSARLQDAFVAGYLDDDELDLRLDRTLAAEDETALRRVLEGLPARFLDGFQEPERSNAHALVRRDADLPTHMEGALVPVSNSARTLVRLIGDTKRTLVLGECAALRTLSVIGDTRIRLLAPDVMPGGATRITFLNIIGDVGIEVPPGVRVVNESVVLIGDLKDPAVDDPTMPHTVILRGLSLIGDVDIRVRED